jgi:hypothetical protein
VANAGHRAAALKVRAPGIEIVVVLDLIVEFPLVVASLARIAGQIHS